MNKIVCFFIVFYQRFISPFFMQRCRFYPSCSEYCLLVFKQHSFFSAVFLTFKRIMMCHPFHKGGVHTKGIAVQQNTIYRRPL